MKERIRIESNVEPQEIPEWVKPAVEQYKAEPVKGLEELEKNEDELTLINDTHVALHDLLSELDLPKVSVPESHIHIITPENYKKCSFRGRGITYFGQIYLQRSSDRIRFLRDLSHEMLHVASMRVTLVSHNKELKN